MVINVIYVLMGCNLRIYIYLCTNLSIKGHWRTIAVALGKQDSFTLPLDGMTLIQMVNRTTI